MKTYQLLLGKLSITLAELSLRHLSRIATEPSSEVKPDLPQGYSHDQALAHLPEYAALYNAYSNRVLVETIEKTVGASRRIAIAEGLIPAEERQALVKVCDLYSFPLPDEEESPKRIGEILWDIAEEFTPGNGIDQLVEAHYWLQGTAGGVSPELISEAIKSFRRDRQRDAAGDGVQDRQGGDESGVAPASDHRKPAVRHGKRGKRVAAIAQ